jgi:hypothetical protein
MQIERFKKIEIMYYYCTYIYNLVIWVISEYAALVKAKYEIYELDGYFYALKPGVNFTNIKISKCTQKTKICIVHM